MLDAIRRYFNRKEETSLGPASVVPDWFKEGRAPTENEWGSSESMVPDPNRNTQIGTKPSIAPDWFKEGRPPTDDEWEPTSVDGKPVEYSPLFDPDPSFGTPLPSQSEERRQDVSETNRLQHQVRSQRADIADIHGEEPPLKDENPGTLAKVFDILLRPNYAVASGVRATAEAGRQEDRKELPLGVDTVPDFFKGMREGWTGRDKSTFKDFLKEDMEIKNNKVTGIGGFILDVGLDPTTYVGSGVIKAAGKGVIETAGLKAAGEAFTDPVVLKAAEDTARNALQQKLLANLGSKAGTKKKALDLSTTEAQDAFVAKIMDDEIMGVARGRAKYAQDMVDTAGKVQLKFAGKVVAESDGLYDVVSKTFKPLRELPPVEALNRMFRPKAELGSMHALTRWHEGTNIHLFNEHLRFFKEQMANLNKDQRIAITHAIEGRKVSSLADPEMRSAAEHIQRMFKNFYHDEVAMGIHKLDKYGMPETFIDNYVYHMYKVDPDKAIAFKEAHRRGGPGFAKERTVASIDDAKKAGMKPIEDIQEIVQERAGKHFQEMTHNSIMLDGIKSYGLKAGTKQAIKVQEALKEMGTELKRFTYNGESALFPKEIANTLEMMNDVHASDKAARGLIRYFDKSQRGMKFWLTVANPGHHVRNFTGNTYQAYQDGVRNPYRYHQALMGVRGAADKIGGENFLRAQNFKIKVGKNSYDSAHELFELYGMSGTKSGFVNTEVAKNTVNRAGNLVRSLSTQREDIARFGHFIDVIAKGAPKNWSKMTKAEKLHHPIVREASERVNKFQFDYNDLTRFERDVGRRILMFYTFARKNTALQVEMLFTRPGKIANVPKANTAIQQMLGVENLALEDEDLWERVPEWVRVMNAPQIGGDNNIIQRVLGTQDPVYGNMLLPTSDLNRLKGPKGIAKDFFSEVRPEIKIPMEMAFGSQAFSGAPVPGGGQYATQQIPVTNLIRKLAFDEDATGKSRGQDVFNYLSGLSTQTVTQDRQRSELRKQQQNVQEMLRRLREEYREQIKEQYRENRR